MRHHGKKGAIKIAGAAVASLNSWTYDAATDKADVTAFGDGNKQYVTGLPDVKGDLKGWFDDAEEALFLAAEGGVPVALELSPSSALPGLNFSGLAYLDCSIDCPSGGPIALSGAWVAAGPWNRTWPPVIAATGATSGAPGTFTPSGAQPPANLAALGGVTASPSTPWTSGQYVTLGDATHAYWNGTTWVAGSAP